MITIFTTGSANEIHRLCSESQISIFGREMSFIFITTPTTPGQDLPTFRDQFFEALTYEIRCFHICPPNVPVQRLRGSAVRCNRLLGVIVPLAPEYNMGGFLRRNELNAFVSQSADVNPLEQSLSPAQQDRRDSDVQIIDEARTKILLDSVRTP